MDASTGPDWFALVDARVVSAAGPADWTLLAHTTHGGPADFTVQSICLLHPPSSPPSQPPAPQPAGARVLRPRRQCVFGERSALQALDGYSRPATQPRLYFITAVAGRRARLEHSLRLHARNAADFGDSTAPGTTCGSGGRVGGADGPTARPDRWGGWDSQTLVCASPPLTMRTTTRPPTCWASCPRPCPCISCRCQARSRRRRYVPPCALTGTIPVDRHPMATLRRRGGGTPGLAGVPGGAACRCRLFCAGC